MKITRITEATDDVMTALGRLLPQLSEDCNMPSKIDIEDIIFHPSSYLFAAQEENNIVGVLTLIVYKIPTGKKAWIEDVVVDKEHHGKGIGKQLVLFAINYARQLGLSQVDLTSSHKRIAANEMYKSLGFEQRTSNLYRINLPNSRTQPNKKN